MFPQVTVGFAIVLFLVGCTSSQSLGKKKMEQAHGAQLTMEQIAAFGFQAMKKKAEQGDTSAQATIGAMYAMGWGVPRDAREAVKWSRKAAEQGDADGQYYLGTMYLIGDGVPQDYIQAYMWLNLAAAQNAGFAERRDTAAARMTPAQIAEAQRLAREWYAAHPQGQR